MQRLSPQPFIQSKTHPFFYRVFKFFASAKLAVLVLFGLMAIMAAGTFVESYHGTETARLLVYESPWFAFVLLLLGISLTAAALDRFPWEKKHIGFVITHLGIILILIGSFVTSKMMIDGQMTIAEGETEYQITLPAPILRVYSETTEQDWIIPLKKHAFPWQGRLLLADRSTEPAFPFRLDWTADFPKAKMRENLKESAEGPPALKVRLKNSFVDQSQWLVLNDPNLGEVQMGPAKLKFTNEKLKEHEAPAPAAGYLEIRFDQKPSIPVSLQDGLKLPASFPLEGTPYHIRITRVLKNALVDERNILRDQDADLKTTDAGKNPAVELVLEGNGLAEKHTVFAKFPDFPTMHGMKPSAAGARIFYRLPNSGSRGESHELRFVENGGEWLYQIQEGLQVKSGKIAVGEPVSLGWMGMEFTVESLWPHSAMDRRFDPEPNTSESEEAVPTVEVEVKTEKETRPVGLRQGVPETVFLDGSKYIIVYGQRRVPAGFKLMLRDFRLEQYPGTSRPASFESDVTLKDDGRGLVRNQTVSMNKPLIYRGFRIYQSGYSQPQGEPEISIFSVGKDPGVPVKYAGTIVMVTGIIMMFYFRRFSSTLQNPGK